MTTAVDELVGLQAFSRDGAKLGKIRILIGDDATDRRYLVISRFLARDLIVPVDAVETPGGRVVVPHGSAFIDSAPSFKARGMLTRDEGDRLESFYKAHTS